MEISIIGLKQENREKKRQVLVLYEENGIVNF
jgi:hypothetical protein